jgi:hypothetical protein
MRTTVTLLIGMIMGIALALAIVQISGGWYVYSIRGETACNRPQEMGTTHIAPNQPNPCLFQSQRWQWP